MIKKIVCTLLFSFSAYTYSASIVIQNEYFPKAGKEKEVYTLRLKASKLLTQLNVPKGRVLIRISEKDRPYVMWECEYVSTEERERVVEIISKSNEFKNVEEEMGALVSHFKRTVWKVAE